MAGPPPLRTLLLFRLGINRRSLPPVPLATDSSSSIRRPPMIFCHVSGSFTILSCNASRRDPVGECLDDVTRRQSWSDFAKRAERERGGKTRTFLDTEFL